MNQKAMSGIILTLTLTTMLTLIFTTEQVMTLEPSPTRWNKTYGGTDADWAVAVVQTVDGGYAIAGLTYSFGAGDGDFWLVKTDSSGNHEWNQTYGGTYTDWARSVVETRDGGYAIAGYTDSFGAGSDDFWLVKVGQYGVIPEFPTWTSILLILFVLTFALIINKQRILKTPLQ